MRSSAVCPLLFAAKAVHWVRKFCEYSCCSAHSWLQCWAPARKPADGAGHQGPISAAVQVPGGRSTATAYLFHCSILGVYVGDRLLEFGLGSGPLAAFRRVRQVCGRKSLSRATVLLVQGRVIRNAEKQDGGICKRDTCERFVAPICIDLHGSGRQLVGLTEPLLRRCKLRSGMRRRRRMHGSVWRRRSHQCYD